MAKVHLKSIEYSYRNSPYYEYFEDKFIKFFNQKNNFLIDINIKSIELMYDLLNLKLNYLKTEKYLNEYNFIDDLRYLASEKKIQSKYSLMFRFFRKNLVFFQT